MFTALLAACRSLPAPEGWVPTAFNLPDGALDLAIEKVRARHGQPALAVAVSRSDGAVRRAVVGTLVQGESAPAKLDHCFHIGSTTKSFTAVLAAQMVEQGTLRWDTKLADALPDVPMRDEYAPVTVHDLLMGASGLLLMHRTDLEPLGMASARVGGWPASSSDPDQPRGHYVNAHGFSPQARDDAYALPAWMNPAGGIHLSIDDFVAWAGGHLRGLRGAGRLLPEEAFRRIHAVHLRVRFREMFLGTTSSAPLELGYGWVIAKAGRYLLSGADGSGGTFYARMALLASHDVAFVGVVNSGAGDPALGAAITAMTGLPW